MRTLPVLCSRVILLLALGVGKSDAGAEAAESDFLSGLSESEREAIGLSALSPEQQAALTKAVERYVSGRSEEAVVEATSEVRTEMSGTLSEREEALAAKEEELAVVRAELEKKTAEAEAASNEKETSLLKRARVLLTPGTKIEFAEINSRLIGPFKGWEEGTVFELENGQRWRVTSSRRYWSPLRDAGLAVTIEPRSLGSFVIRIEGVRTAPKVELVNP